MVKLFISSVQREFERERREVAAYIRQDEDFMVTLWRKEGVITSNDREKDSRNDSLSDSVNSTYQAIKANPGIQRKRISELTGKSIPTIDRHIALLAKSNLIEHRDSDKTGGYYVKKDEDKG